MECVGGCFTDKVVVFSLSVVTIVSKQM